MGTIDEFISHNEEYAAGYTGAGLSASPVRETAVVACMDARLDIHGMLGLHPGDAHVIRNAGGIVTEDVLRSLAISQHVLGTSTVIVIQHTNCGLAGTTDEAVASTIQSSSGIRPEFAIGAFAGVENSVRGSLRALRASPLIRDSDMRGFVFDTETGSLTEVV